MIARLKTPPSWPQRPAAIRSTLTASTLVVCAGIPRSGSTWLYNAARLLLTATAGDAAAVHGAWIEHYEPSNGARFHVVKIHEPDEALAWRAKAILTSRRDLRDIAASAWKRSWISDEPSALAFVDSVIRQHQFWQQRCAFQMVYERMHAEPRAELVRVADALNFGIDVSAAADVLKAIDALGHEDDSEHAFDAGNLLHKKHIMDGRVGYHSETLPPDLLQRINSRCAEWLAANGYAG